MADKLAEAAQIDWNALTACFLRLWIKDGPHPIHRANVKYYIGHAIAGVSVWQVRKFCEASGVPFTHHHHHHHHGSLEMTIEALSQELDGIAIASIA